MRSNERRAFWLGNNFAGIENNTYICLYNIRMIDYARII